MDGLQGDPAGQGLFPFPVGWRPDIHNAAQHEAYGNYLMNIFNEPDQQQPVALPNVLQPYAVGNQPLAPPPVRQTAAQIMRQIQQIALDAEYHNRKLLIHEAHDRKRADRLNKLEREQNTLREGMLRFQQATQRLIELHRQQEHYYTDKAQLEFRKIEHDRYKELVELAKEHIYTEKHIPGAQEDLKDAYLGLMRVPKDEIFPMPPAFPHRYIFNILPFPPIAANANRVVMLAPEIFVPPAAPAPPRLEHILVDLGAEQDVLEEGDGEIPPEEEEEEEEEEREDNEPEYEQKDDASKLVRIEALRVADELPSTLAKRYKRACTICLTANPLKRAVMVACGHMTCVPCAEFMANADGRLECQYCRAETTYVRCFEEEEEEDKPKVAALKRKHDDDDCESSPSKMTRAHSI